MKALDFLFPSVLIAFLAFLGGTYVMYADLFPAAALTQAYKGGRAIVDQKTKYRHPYFSRFHMTARSSQRGVTIHDPDRVQQGYTLYTSGHEQSAFLIDLDGNPLHEWRLPFSEVWDETSPVKKPVADSHIAYDQVHLYPNGDLLVIYTASGDTPWGYGIARLSWDSKLVWRYLGQIHHEFDIGPDGRIYTLSHEIGNDVIEAWTNLKPPRIDDFLVVLSPDGEELRKIPLLDALIASPYARMLTKAAWYLSETGDYLHTNSVDVVTEEQAKAFLLAKPGDVLLSMRELGTGTVAVLDMETETISWATQGSFTGQHDPDILENGNILLFDNRGDYGPHGAARVIEFNPETMGIVWSYNGSPDRPFESVLRSNQQRLANGNTLIVESDGGRIFEVTPDKDIVWEFINPVRGGEENEFIPIVQGGWRIDPATLDQEFAQIISGRSKTH